MSVITRGIVLFAGVWIGGIACTTEETPVTAEVRITPGSGTVAPEASIGLRADAYDQRGTLRSAGPVTWSSRTPAIATVGPTTGLVIGVTPGVVEISATIDGVVGTALVTVAWPDPQVRSIRIEPAGASIRTGDIRNFNATPLDGQGNPVLNLSAQWQTSDPLVATVSSGQVTAVGQGQAVIYVRVRDQTASVVVDVAARAASVELIGRSDLDEVTDTVQLTAAVRDGQGALLHGWPVQWSSSDPQIAKVSPSGKVSSEGLGTATITARSEQSLAVMQVVVTRHPVAQVTIPFALGALPRGRMLQLQAVATDAGGLVLRRTALWVATNPQVATIGPTGILTTFSPGTVVVTATMDGVPASAAIQVIDLPSSSLSLGYSHSCSLSGGGQVYCWGWRPSSGAGSDTCIDVTYYDYPFECTRTPTPVAGGQALVSVVAGGFHTCGLTAAGAAYCWGVNWSHQGGNGSTNQSETPLAVTGGHTFVSLALGYDFSCGLKAGGEVWCWGQNSSGQLGNGSALLSAIPVRVVTSQQFVQISAGSSFACGLTVLGKAYCWGYNQSGQVGDGTTTNRNTPTAVLTSQVFVDLSAGGNHVCALTVAGAAWCWGSGSSGQIGDLTGVSRSTPVQVGGGHQWFRISAGGQSTCAVRIDGAGFCWGANYYGAVGDGTSRMNRLGPSMVVGSQTFLEIAAGGYHACGRSTAGSVYCWGQGQAGALGLGAEVVDQLAPKKTLGNP